MLFIVCGEWPAATKLLIGWDVAVALYLVLAIEMVVRSDMSHIRSRAAMQDEGALALLLLPVAAAIAKFRRDLCLKVCDRQGVGELRLARCAGGHDHRTVVDLHPCTPFALHYAHDYYGEGERANGLIFPGKDKPDYWGLCVFRVRGRDDVPGFRRSGAPTRLIRRLVVTHGALSFVFNTAILAVTVNLATGAIGS